MSGIILNTFKIENVWYEHFIDTKTDNTAISNESDEIIMIVTAEGYLSILSKKVANPFGKFYLDNSGYWHFEFLNDPSKEHISSGNKNLIKFEMVVFKRLVQEGIICSS